MFGENFKESPSKKKHMGEKQKLQKEMKKRYGSFDPFETPANLRSDLSIQGRKEYEGKIKIENKLIDSGCNGVLQKVKILRQGLSTAFVSGTRSRIHKMVFQNFEDMKSIWGCSPNVEPVSFGIDSTCIRGFYFINKIMMLPMFCSSWIISKFNTKLLQSK